MQHIEFNTLGVMTISAAVFLTAWDWPWSSKSRNDANAEYCEEGVSVLRGGAITGEGFPGGLVRPVGAVALNRRTGSLTSQA